MNSISSIPWSLAASWIYAMGSPSRREGEGRQWGQQICSTGFFPAGSPWLDAYFSFFHMILPRQILAAIPPLALLGLEVQVVLLWLDFGYCITFCRVSLPAFEFSSVQFSHSVVSDSLRPHESQHARPPCPSPTPGVHSDSRPLSRWCHPAISSSVVPFSSCPQSFPASESFPMSQLFAFELRPVNPSNLN